MTKYQKFAIVLLRISMGALFFYAGISKIIDPSWSAQEYLEGARNFKSIFSLLTADNVLPIVNILNEWSLALLGASLLLGVLISFSAPLGALLMLLYYLAQPITLTNSYFITIDQHIIYAFALLVLAAFKAGEYAGIDKLLFAERAPKVVPATTYKPGPYATPVIPRV
jgi:thiosulfate dehydrogenase [quinone] large subunit